jgi:hypothetical protein
MRGLIDNGFGREDTYDVQTASYTLSLMDDILYLRMYLRAFVPRYLIVAPGVETRSG